MKHGLLSVTSRLLAFVITSLCPTNTTPTRKSEVIQKYKYQKDVHIKGIVWEIYECVSEVLSHLGRMFGMIFRVQWGQKSPKSLSKMYPSYCKGAAQGPCKGTAPDMLLLPAAPLQAPLNPKNHTKHPP